MEATTRTPKNGTKKGNKTTEIILGTAAAKIEMGVKALQTAVEEVNKLEEKAQECTLRVTDLEDKIGGLDSELQNKKAQNKFELELAYKADKQSFANDWLDENDFIFIKQSDYDELKSSLEKATKDVASQINTEVAKVTNSINSKHQQETKIAQLEHEKKEASNTAQIGYLTDQIKFLGEQVDMWKKALDSERQASIERSKASSIGTLNVGGANQGR